MKKLLTLLVVVLMVLGVLAGSAAAFELPGRVIDVPGMPFPVLINEPNNSITVNVNGQKVSFPDQRPYIDANNRTLVPIRFIAEELGAEVSWDDGERVVIIEQGEVEKQELQGLSLAGILGAFRGQMNGTMVALQIENSRAVVNGEWRTFDTEPVIVNGRTMVPLRFISETLGAKVEWDGTTRTVNIWTGIVVEDGWEYYYSGEYKLPKQTEMVVEPYSTEHRAICFGIALHKNINEQVVDFYNALNYKFGPRLAQEITDYAMLKVDEGARYNLETRYFYPRGYKVSIGSNAGNWLVPVVIWEVD